MCIRDRPRGEEAPLGMHRPHRWAKMGQARLGGEPVQLGAVGDLHATERLSPAAASAGSTRSSPRLASNMASPRDSRQSARAESREAEDDLQAELRKPWRGQADKLKPAQKDVLACFEEQGVTKNVMDDGVMVKRAATKYRNKSKLGRNTTKCADEVTQQNAPMRSHNKMRR